MSFFKRAKEVASDFGAASKRQAQRGKRQAQRGKLEVEMRRLESKVGSEKDGIGHALFPLLESGSLQVDSPEVQEHMSAIVALTAEIAAKKAEIEALGKPEGGGEGGAKELEAP